QEYIKLGQRIKGFKLEYEHNGTWQLIDRQTTIGYKRLLRFQPVTATKVRFTVEDAKDLPVIASMGIYNAPSLLVAPKFKRSKDGVITLTPADASTLIFYTLDGSTPTRQSLRYEQPFTPTHPVTLKAVTFDAVQNKFSDVITLPIDVAKKQWRVVGVSGGNFKEAEKAIDDNPVTAFTTTATEGDKFITISLGEEHTLTGFTYLPSQDRWASGTISRYVFEVSLDGNRWTKVIEGEFGNIKNNPIEQRIGFPAQKARFIRLTSKAVTDDSKRASFAEIGIITK
ncbi:discoidin domain-containing protein, partial [Capnocytophaga sp.]|uniref:discoidin domain-containing protein n=1 Tax=Capnocytophaga sp. TaxID=44737 RepID=UPI0026DCC5E0